MSEGKESTVPRNYCLLVSPLHAKVAIIIGTNAKRRLTRGNGSDAKRGLADIGLHVEQMSPNNPGGQMLVVNFLSRSGFDTWPIASVTWHTLHGATQTLSNGMAKQSSLRSGQAALLSSSC